MNRAWMSKVAVAGVAATLLIGCGLFAAPPYQGPEPEHFDGRRFQNQADLERNGFGAFWKWRMGRDEGEWPDEIEAEPGPPPPERVDDGQLRVTWINHATALVQMDGLNVLTDPIWSERASPVSWAGPTREHQPGVSFEDLPPIDVVVISHNHYDHLDLPTLKRLADEHSPRFVTPLGNAQLLYEHGIENAGDLDWWQRIPVSDKVRVTLVPAQHYSQRGLADRAKTLWGGYVIDGPSGPVYFAGDTGWGPHFEQVREEFGPVRLAILPIGAYRPRWFMGPVHISPEEAVEAHRELDAQTSVGMHFGTFRLADDGYAEPVEDLEAALEAQEVSPEAFWVLEVGEGREVP